MATGASLSNYAENLLLNWSLTNQQATRPTQWFVALFSDINVVSDQPSNELNSSTAQGYSRKAVSFDAAANGMTSNSNMLKFSALNTWPTVGSIAIMDAATDGNMLFWGKLAYPKTLDNEDELQFAVNTIKIYLD